MPSRSVQRQKAPRGYAGCSNLPSDLRKLDDNFDVVGFSLQGLLEILRLFVAGDQAIQPLRVEASQPLIHLVPVTLVRIHAADNHIVLQDRRRCHVAHGPAGDPARRGGNTSCRKSGNDGPQRQRLPGAGGWLLSRRRGRCRWSRSWGRRDNDRSRGRSWGRG